MCTYIYIYIYIYEARDGADIIRSNRHRLNGYVAQRVPSLFLASSFRMCLNCEALDGMFPWRTRYPLSQVPIKPVPLQCAPRLHTPISFLGLQPTDIYIYIYMYAYIYIYIYICIHRERERERERERDIHITINITITINNHHNKTVPRGTYHE